MIIIYDYKILIFNNANFIYINIIIYYVYYTMYLPNK